MDPKQQEEESEDAKESLKKSLLKKQISTPKIIYNNILSSILNDPRVKHLIFNFASSSKF
jgi:hypothetical protein